MKKLDVIGVSQTGQIKDNNNSLMKRMNSNGPRLEPWGTPEVAMNSNEENPL